MALSAELAASFSAVVPTASARLKASSSRVCRPVAGSGRLRLEMVDGDLIAAALEEEGEPDEVEEADDGAVSEREKPLLEQRFQALRRAGSTASLPGRIL